ncbi:MAG TPA: hypothetical protein VN151_13580, partial [Terracidiphilus sp.]|nr:hypothetical protein [Terracidiphilus sp.]
MSIFVAGSGSTFAASSSRVHKKAAATASHTKTKTKAAPARAGKRSSASSARSRSRKASAVGTSRKRGTLRRNVSLSRTRSHRGLATHAAPPAPAPKREADSSAEDVASAPVAVDRTRATQPADTSAGPVVARAATAQTDTPAAVSSIPLHAPIVAMAPLRGSMESLVRQNEKTDADNLERIENDDDLNHRIARGVLVPVPASDRLVVNPGLPQNRRYCRPWTATFLSDLARAHDAEFHRAFIVSS